jgi:hypothetical protein
LPQTPTFEAARGWLWPPIEGTERLPLALVERFGAGRSLSEALRYTLRFLAPLTSQSAAQKAPSLGGL